MKSAREEAHAYLEFSSMCRYGTPPGAHIPGCDRLTAAIEQRDREARAEALEAAAKLCDDTAEMECSTTAAMLAKGIRSLAVGPKAGG